MESDAFPVGGTPRMLSNNIFKPIPIKVMPAIRPDQFSSHPPIFFPRKIVIRESEKVTSPMIVKTNIAFVIV